MKKTLLGMLTAILISGVFTACGGKTETVQVADSEVTVVVDTVVKLPAYVYPEENNYMSVIYAYLIDSLGSKYSQSEACIPQATVVRVDETNQNNILVWGDYWVFNYDQVDDTLKTVSGGNHPGLMHVKQVGKSFQVVGFDQVKDGAGNEASAKKIFGLNLAKYRKMSAENEREKVRKSVIAEYVKRNKLPITCYQDYGHEAIMLDVEE